mgnify:CR=1 FL=1
MMRTGGARGFLDVPCAPSGTSMRAFTILLLSMLAAGCGAKTGLLVPDAALPDDRPDVASDAPDVFDVPDTCVGRPLPLERFAAEVVFVIDRSGSMNDPAPSGVTRWRALTTALEAVLPAVDRELLVGLIQYPGPITATNACGDNSRLEFTPRLLNARPVLGALARTTPIGGTPTYEALGAVEAYYGAVPPVGRVRGRYVVLATDGGPNCNGALSASACVCTNTRGCGGFRGNLSCLDDARTIERLAAMARAGHATFVIGIPGEDLRALPQTLERMAVAGGRPRLSPGVSAYYRAEDVGEFTAAFRTITTELVRCRYVTNPVADPMQVSVHVGARVVRQDRTHTDGWDWTSPATGEIVLYGAACEASQRADGVVSVRYGCVE